jgi:hypothetical protein
MVIEKLRTCNSPDIDEIPAGCRRLRPEIHDFHVIHFSPCKGKGKAIPLQAWTGPEGSRRLRFPDFQTVGT